MAKLSLKRRYNVGCVSLFYRYYNRYCSNEISGHMPESLHRLAHPYLVDWPSMSYEQNSFFNRSLMELPSSRGYNLGMKKDNQKINGHMTENNVFLRKISLHRLAHPYLVDCPSIPYTQN